MKSPINRNFSEIRRIVQLLINADEICPSFVIFYGKQEKYAFEYIADAGTKSVGRVVPKTFKDRHDAFFHLANKHLADATGMTHVLRRGAAKAR